MSHWSLTLKDVDRKVTLERHIQLCGPHHLIHIEGDSELSSTWHFTQIGDDTQVKDQFVCDIGKMQIPFLPPCFRLCTQMPLTIFIVSFCVSLLTVRRAKRRSLEPKDRSEWCSDMAAAARSEHQRDCIL